MKNKEIMKTGFEKYLDEFDERYRKHYHDKQKEIPMLLNLFEKYEEDIYTPSILVNQEENELLEQIRYCIGAETGELVEKAFIFGFCVAKSLKEETHNYISCLH